MEQPPGTSLPAGGLTATAKIYTLANVLAPCINSDGGAGCQPLFTAATQSGTAPTNTVDAALNIARKPFVNVSGVFSVINAQAPFQNALSVAPHDWTLYLSYGNCISGCGGISTPGSVAIDSTGNVWVANYFGATVSKFSPAGVPASLNGFPGVGLEQSYGLTVDAQNNAWVTNEASVPAANNGGVGSVSKFSSTGAELSGAGFTAGDVYYPVAVAADSTGVIWVADHSSSSATLLASDGSAISGGSGYAVSQLPFTSAVALDSSHNAWFAVQRAAVRVTPLGAVTTFSCCTLPQGIAIDQSGNVWVADYGGYKIVKLTSAGATASSISTVSGNASPLGIAVDGAGNVWTANYYGNSVTKLLGSSATLVSPVSGFGLDAPLNEPYGIAIDASGGVWISNAGNDTITEFVGLASPIQTPLLGPPLQP